MQSCSDRRTTSLDHWEQRSAMEPRDTKGGMLSTHIREQGSSVQAIMLEVLKVQIICSKYLNNPW